ncbi:hypothetical protein LFL97_28955 [Burkholderia sp. JSH-S8]|uniref:hypothetical protein n=1 Tax=Burkholderia stagnalis TaxID=1503054 RepID=UPI000F8083E8|nr:hypothetical protein [Burkholderia stagnalis]WGS44616.1 hypothetical protein LFL97_28955 [Burkholderia sp. JSH-S8]
MSTQMCIDLPPVEPTVPTEIVLSLQDRAYELIKSGVKKLEFRKRWRSGPCIAYIYRSGTKKELSAYMKLGTPIYGSPQEIGRLAEQMLPGNGPAVEEYLVSTQGGYAIPIEAFREFRPFSLAELRVMGFHPPQYFFYLSKYPELKRALEVRRNG